MVATFIKKINKIKSFGSFEDFTWPNTLPEFKKHNLLYGKNGSGKTTLSQFFQCYEENQFPEDFTPTPSMEITTNQGKFSDFTALHKYIKVFNVYYIQNNLFWDGGHATNLLWLGKDDIEKQIAIAELDAEIEELNIARPIVEKEAIDAEDSIDRLLMDHSKIIRTFLKYPQSKYQKGQLKKDLDNIISGSLIANSLSDAEFQSKEIIVHSSVAELEVSKFSVMKLNLKQISNLVITKLSEKITPTTKIDELMQNPTLKQWVEKGLEHHHEPGECKFCKETLTEKRLADLKGFFDDTQKQFIDKLKNQISDLTQLKNNLPRLTLESPKITDEYKQDNVSAIQNFQKMKEKVEESIEALLSALINKEKNLYADFQDKCIQLKELNWDYIEQEYQTSALEVNKVREKHNNHVKYFDTNKKKAQRDVELHLALQQKDEYISRKTKETESRNKVTDLAASLATKTTKIASIKGQISSSHQAAEFINELLKKMGHTHIKLEYDSVQQAYLLKRGGSVAKRLSEGEKTAIAFAHFIASLKQKEFNLIESVVVIDDPISSLDATACYFIYGLIKSLETQVSQLFLMTHSHSFFVLLIKHFRDKKVYGHYEVHRFIPSGTDIGHSKIIEMEDKKLTYYSEYNYLFSQVFQASKEISSGTEISFDRLYSLMNCSRKLIEGFLGFRYPHKLGDLEKKWKKAVEDFKIDSALQQAIFKVINFGSHSGIDAFFEGSGLDASEMAHSISLVLSFIQQVDPKHYEGMVICEGEQPLEIKLVA